MNEKLTLFPANPLDRLMTSFSERAGIDRPQRDEDDCFGLLFNQQTAVYLRSDTTRNRIALFSPFPHLSDDGSGDTWRRLLYFNAAETTTNVRFALEPDSKTPLLILEIPAEDAEVEDLENALSDLLDAVERITTEYGDSRPTEQEPNPDAVIVPEPEVPRPTETLAAPPPYLLA